MVTLVVVLVAIAFLFFIPGQEPSQKSHPNVAQGATDEVTESEMINVVDYGAVGDGETDDTAAIQKALDDGGYLFFPAGTYLISESLEVSAKKLQGVGMSHSTILSNADAPILIMKGSNNDIRDLALQYEGWNQDEHKNRNAIEFQEKVAHSTFENLRLISVYRGFHIKESDDEVFNAFSVNIRNIYVYNYAKNALNFVPEKGGLSGSVIENFYTHNGNRENRYEEEVIPFVFANTAELTLIQLNVEWSNISSAFKFNTVRNVVLISPHIEGTDMFEEGSAYYDISNSNVKILGNRMINNQVHNQASIYKVYGNSTLSVDGFHGVTTKTVDRGEISIIQAASGESNSIDVSHFDSDVTDLGIVSGQQNKDGTPILKEFNGEMYFQKMGIHNSSKLPPPSEELRGAMFLIDNGDSDGLYILMKKGNSYEWVQIE